MCAEAEETEKKDLPQDAMATQSSLTQYRTYIIIYDLFLWGGTQRFMEK